MTGNLLQECGSGKKDTVAAQRRAPLKAAISPERVLHNRHLLASSATIGTLLLDCSVLLGRFVHELVSVLAALLNFLLLALPPLLVLRNRVLHLLAIKIGHILDLLLFLLLLGHGLFI